MKDENTFWKENYNIAIDQDGNFVSVPAIETEIDHWQIYARLNKKLGGIMGEIKPWDLGSDDNTCYDLPNRLAKLKYINIYPSYLINNDEFFVIFPYKPTKKQIETFKTLYEHFSNSKYKFNYFEKPNDELCLDYDLITEGVDNLKKFVKEIELLIEQNNQER